MQSTIGAIRDRRYASAMELNRFSYDFHESSYRIYRWLRDPAPGYRNDDLDFLELSRDADVVDAIVDHQTYSSAKGTVFSTRCQAAHAAKRSGSSVTARKTRLGCSGSGAVVVRSNDRVRASNARSATCASRRARFEPRQ